jgi:hypothetical protein
MALVVRHVNIWRLAGDTLNITCNVLYGNRQVHRDFLITLYFFEGPLAIPSRPSGKGNLKA